MYPLLFCSILVWAIAIEKFFSVSVFKRQTLFLYQKIEELIRDRKIHEAKGVCSSVTSFISVPYIAMLESTSMKKDVREQRISRKLMETQQWLKRFLWVLATVAAVAPFLGLFGTVVGIMRSFNSIANSGKSGFVVIAPGLAEALITTAGGILVAVMSLVFYNYFQAVLGKSVLIFKNQVEELMEIHGEY